MLHRLQRLAKHGWRDYLRQMVLAFCFASIPRRPRPPFRGLVRTPIVACGASSTQRQERGGQGKALERLTESDEQGLEQQRSAQQGEVSAGQQAAYLSFRLYFRSSPHRPHPMLASLAF